MYEFSQICLRIVENSKLTIPSLLNQQINKIGGHGWPTAYIVDWTLYVIEWIISQLKGHNYLDRLKNGNFF